MKLQTLPILFTALVFLQACGTSQQSAPAEQAIPEYPVMTIQPQSTSLNTDYKASIEGQQNIEIRPKIDGFVAQIFVDEGALVKKGQLLFKIDAPQYEQEVKTAAAAIKNAEAEVNTAKMQVEKTEPLVKEEIVSMYELKQARYNLHAREAALAQARASLANARTNVSYTNIVSPADGLIGNIPYKTGSLVSSSSAQPLTTVSNVSAVYAYFSFNEKQLLDFADQYPGTSMREKLAHFPEVSLILANGKAYPQKGKIESVGGLINTATGSVNLRAKFLNPEGLIRSGASATIRIPVVLKQALLIPSKASYEMQEKTMVFLVGTDNLVKSTEITVLDNSSAAYYVVQQGLKAGDRLVTEGMGSLKDGTRIKPIASKK